MHRQAGVPALPVGKLQEPPVEGVPHRLVHIAQIKGIGLEAGMLHYAENGEGNRVERHHRAKQRRRQRRFHSCSSPYDFLLLNRSRSGCRLPCLLPAHTPKHVRHSYC